jgi:N-acetylglucosamine-6-phosphate deacetylase
MIDGDYVIRGARLVLPASILEGASLVVRGGLIDAILDRGEALPPDLPVLDAGGAWVGPGLVDLHIHGAGGMAFEEISPDRPAEGAAILSRLAAFLAARGVTSFVPTITCRDEAIAGIAAALELAGLPPATVPGIYVEGPFVDPGHRGGIEAQTIEAFDRGRLEAIIAMARGRLRLMTYAPELEGSGELCRLLEAAGVIPCLGHSGARLPGLALPGGAFSITHLFNAMSPFSHREGEAGLALLPFVDGRPFVELNADGVHVNDEAVLAVRRALDPGRIILISDAAPPAGLAPGRYEMRGRTLESGARGVRYADSNVLMGSSSLVSGVFRRYLGLTACPVPEAMASASLVPARLLGMAGRRGAIAPGLEAALVIWEGDFEAVRATLLPQSPPALGAERAER